MVSSFMNNRSTKSRHIALVNEINVTPFVDVMLVLLIVFMITSPMLISGINVDLPESSASALSGQDEPLSISIANDGNVYIQNNMINANDLIQKLEAITKYNKETRIFVRGDKNVDYGKVMKVVSLINEAGFGKVSLVTEMITMPKVATE